jgi:hypothetical protein
MIECSRNRCSETACDTYDLARLATSPGREQGGRCLLLSHGAMFAKLQLVVGQRPWKRDSRKRARSQAQLHLRLQTFTSMT